MLRKFISITLGLILVLLILFLVFILPSLLNQPIESTTIDDFQPNQPPIYVNQDTAVTNYGPTRKETSPSSTSTKVLNIFVYEVINADDVIRGQSVMIREIGPFVFRVRDSYSSNQKIYIFEPYLSEDANQQITLITKSFQTYNKPSTLIQKILSFRYYEQLNENQSNLISTKLPVSQLLEHLLSPLNNTGKVLDDVYKGFRIDLQVSSKKICPQLKAKPLLAFGSKSCSMSELLNHQLQEQETKTLIPLARFIMVS